MLHGVQTSLDTKAPEKKKTTAHKGVAHISKPLGALIDIYVL